eukprot:10368855-Alexandrium_andersonii.AAC.1
MANCKGTFEMSRVLTSAGDAAGAGEVSGTATAKVIGEDARAPRGLGGGTGEGAGTAQDQVAEMALAKHSS